MNTCASSIAKSFGPNCDNPIQGGWTGRALLFNADAVEVVFAATQNKGYEVQSIGDSQDQGPLNMVAAAILNFGDAPFTGTNVASTNENGLPEYTKTFSFSIPKHGEETAADIDNLRYMRFIIVAEREEKKNSYVVIGAHRPLKVNGDGVTQDEYTENGAIQITASTREAKSEVLFFPPQESDLTAKEAFNAAFAAAPNA